MLRGMNRLTGMGLAVLSGLLLSAAFPPLDWGFLAWFALVPLLLICWFVTPRRAFALGGLAGAVFWFSSTWWLLHVTWAGMIAVCLYSALYVAAFAWAAAWCLRLPGMRGRLWSFGPLVAWPALWVAFEFLRGSLLTGFPWSPLGNALYRNLFVAQAAEWGGVYLLSFLVMLPAAGIALTLARFAEGWRRGTRVPHLELWVSVLAVAVCFHTGQRRFERFRSRAANMTVAAIQPNVPQFQKWDESYRSLIHERLEEGVRLALARGKPDLMAWPETALPDYVLFSRSSFDLVAGLLKHGVPILAGSLHYTMEQEQPRHYNSAFLFLPGQEGEPARYDKRQLVLFGEYVPFERYLAFLRHLTPIEGSLAHGREDTVFWLPGTRQFFSVLICFEDAFPWLARRFVHAGARMLVNQTNDAWFDPSPASRQHLAHSVMRAIENRVPVVRATNSGFTCVLDRTGQVLGSIPIGAPDAQAADCLVERLFVPDADMSLSFYTRHGDWFAWACSALAAVLLLAAWRVRQKSAAGPACPEDGAPGQF
jgi:apolipoprotein N-acyltransferase